MSFKPEVSTGMTDKHECGLGRTYCTQCQTELEVGQVGCCDECSLKKWYALNQEGDMVYVGEFKDFADADESLEYSPVWLVDEETARTWLVQLTELLK